MKRIIVAFLHLLFWLVYLFMMMAISYILFETNEGLQQLNEENTAQLFVALIFLPALISFYFFYFFLFPRFFKQKRYFRAILGGVIISFVSTFLGYLSLEDIFQSYCMENDQTLQGARLFFSFINVFCCTGALVIRGFSNWFEQVEQKEVLLHKNHEIQLALVKSQLDPHFLFNTINNIDVLILKDAEKASDYLNRLSDIMRFVLYETKTETIPLKQEIAYIEKYIALQKIRTANTTYVQLDIKGDPSNWQIAPVVFIPFIENAFKHCTNKKEKNAITIHIDIKEKTIVFICKNKFQQNSQLKNYNNGLGNELIEQRLELLYPQSHQLQVEEKNGYYIVQLSIQNK